MQQDTINISGTALLETSDAQELEEFSKPKKSVPSKNGEYPKVAVSRSYWHAIIRCSIHIPSLAITLGVLSLTFRTVFWQAPGPNINTHLNALQFAAKAHEGFIVLSLCAMILHHLRHYLLGPRGVPLGLLSSAFQLNSVAYFFSTEFWGGMRINRLSKVPHLPLILGILVAFLLANLAGPSSAITMIPKLDWWPLNDLWLANEIRFSAYIGASNSTLFPESLTRSLVPDHCFEAQADGMTQKGCPSAGLSNILTTAPMFGSLSSPYEADVSLNMNFTMPAANNSVSRFLSGEQSNVNRGNSSLYLASTVPDFAASSLYWWYSLVRDSQAGRGANPGPIRSSQPLVKAFLRKNKELLQLNKPLVQVECQASRFGDPRVVFPHQLFWTPPWNNDDYSNADWSISTPQTFANMNTTKVNFSWIDLGISAGPRPSILALFTMPRHNNLSADMYACTVDARWVPSHPWIVPTTDGFVHDSVSPVNDVLAENGVKRSLPPVYIDLGWAQALNIVYDAAQNLTGLEALGSACAEVLSQGGDAPLYRNSDPTIQCLNSALALYLTDGLARVQSSLPTYFLTSGETAGNKVLRIQYMDRESTLGTQIPSMSIEDFRDTNRFTEIHLPVWRYGYGYGFTGTTIYIATAVLLLHSLLAVIHIGVVMVSGISSAAWDSAGEMLILAMNSSTSSQLENTCAGVESSKTWGLLAKVRETSDAQLELVLDGDERQNDNLFISPQQNKVYGSLPKGGKVSKYHN